MGTNPLDDIYPPTINYPYWLNPEDTPHITIVKTKPTQFGTYTTIFKTRGQYYKLEHLQAITLREEITRILNRYTNLRHQSTP